MSTRFTDAMQAIRIQRAWKKAPRFAHIFQRYLDLGLHKIATPALGFDLLVTTLRRPDVIDASKTCLALIHYLTLRSHTSAQEGHPRVNIRVFLSAFMIAFFPANVFETTTPLVTRLIALAVALLDSFEHIVQKALAVDSFAHRDILQQARLFNTTLLEFIRVFTEWKTPDATRLVARIQAALVALYDGVRNMQDDPDPFRVDVLFYTHHAHIARNRSKLAQILGGDALVLLDAQHPPPPPPRDPLTIPRKYQDRLPSPEMVAHELSFDKDYTLTLEELRPHKPPFCASPATDAFWLLLASDALLPEPTFIRPMYIIRCVIDAANEIRPLTFQDHHAAELAARFTALTALSPQESATLVPPVLDTVMLALLPLMTPDRADVIRPAWPRLLAGPFADAVRFLSDTADHMLLDASLQRINTLAPVVRDLGVAFERDRFNDRFPAGDDDLPNTQVPPPSPACRLHSHAASRIPH